MKKEKVDKLQVVLEQFVLFRETNQIEHILASLDKHIVFKEGGNEFIGLPSLKLHFKNRLIESFFCYFYISHIRIKNLSKRIATVSLKYDGEIKSEGQQYRDEGTDFLIFTYKKKRWQLVGAELSVEQENFQSLFF